MEHGALALRPFFYKLQIIVSKRVKLALHYRFDFLAALALSFIQLFAYRALWKAAYETGVGDRSVPLDLLISYIIVGNIMAEVLTVSLWDDFNWRLKEGSIVADLTRPMDFETQVFFQSLGDTCGKIVNRLLPKIVVAWVIFRFYVPMDWSLWAVFLVSLVLGYLLLFCLNFLVSAAAFVFTEVWGIEAVKNLLVLIFSGIYIPLWMYPAWMQPVVNLAPFRGYLAIPVSIYVGRIPLYEALPALTFQVIWTLVFFVLGRLLLRAALKRAVLYGG